tara:strand:+ start:322 stop:1029 length:708 start_codon:yes stop_codon:yes gene_type:complete
MLHYSRTNIVNKKDNKWRNNQEAWEKDIYIWRRDNNNLFNNEWIKKFNFKFTKNISFSDLKKIDFNIDENDSGFMVSWLKNIDRLIDMTPYWFYPERYNIVDAGCGSGIPVFYFHHNYNFKNIIGFDFSKTLVDYAKENLLIYQKKAIKKTNNIKFLNENGNIFKLEDVSNFIYMANPFSKSTTKKFLENNINILKKNKCIIALANDKELDVFLDSECFSEIIRDDLNNLSIIIF